jgi:hypothetical protein
MKPSHLAYLCQVVSMKNAKHKKNHMPYSPSKMRYRVWRSCPCTPNEFLLDHFVTLHSSNELKFGTLMYHHMSKGFTILSCYIGLSFWNYHGQTRKQGDIREASVELTTQCGVMVHHIWAHNTSWPVQKDSYTLHIIWSTLVWPNFVKFKGNS